MNTALNITAIIVAILLIIAAGPILGILGAGALYLSGANTSVDLIKGKSSDAKRISRGF